jgi:magnesium transporter
VLQGLGTTARRNHRILAALAGISHLLGFLGRTQGSLPEALSRDRLLSLEGEISHLTAQSETLVNEATFLLDAIVGAISIEQNNVIKIFSMVSVILMPPTMIASIYGMNFVHMPELAQPWGLSGCTHPHADLGHCPVVVVQTQRLVLIY